MQGKIIIRGSLLLTMLTCVAQAGWAADAATTPALRITSGFDTSTGTYGTSQTTTINSIPVVVAVDTGPWTFKLALPYVRISGSGNVVPGVGKVRNVTGASTSASGMGDAVAYAVYNLVNDPSRQMGIDLTGKIKFATADADKGLGTGQNDYAVQVDIYKKIQRTTLFGTVGYAMLGSSSTLVLNDVFNTSVGASYQLSEVDHAGMSLDYRQKASATGFDQRELMGFVSHKFDRHWKGQLYVVKGFSDGSPDWGGGASIGYAF